MSLLTALSNLESRPLRKGPACTVSRILEELTEDERTALLQAIDNPRIPCSMISRTLTANGYQVASRTILRHRRRGESDGCRCAA